MEETTVDLTIPSYYAHPDTAFNKFKSKLQYKHILKLINNNLINKIDFKLLEVGNGSGFLISLLEEKYSKAILRGLEYDPRLVELTQKKLN
jgi:hypothetical protein